MLKIVVYDCGVGGVLFANYLQRELPVVEVIRLTDPQNSELSTSSRREARRNAEAALRPYIGKVDLIVLANHFLTITSLRYFRQKHPEQRFLGFALPSTSQNKNRRVLILTTPAVSRTLAFHVYTHRIRQKTTTLAHADLPARIDEARFSLEVINKKIVQPMSSRKFDPKEIVLACSHFSALVHQLVRVYGKGIRIDDSYYETLRAIHRTLGIKSCFKQK